MAPKFKLKKENQLFLRFIDCEYNLYMHRENDILKYFGEKSISSGLVDVINEMHGMMSTVRTPRWREQFFENFFKKIDHS